MASNEVEVLDPAATVANLKKSASGRALNRRNFMTTALGVAGAASGAALVSGRSRSPLTVSAASAPNQGDVLNLSLIHISKVRVQRPPPVPLPPAASLPPLAQPRPRAQFP